MLKNTTPETNMTRHEAIVKLADTLEIERTDAADLIDEYALNAGDVKDVEEIVEVTSERVAQIIDDRQEELTERQKYADAHHDLTFENPDSPRGSARNTAHIQQWLDFCPAVKAWKTVDDETLEFVYDTTVEVAQVPEGVEF